MSTAADTATVDTSLFPQLASVTVRNEGMNNTGVGGQWISVAENATFNITKLSVAAAAGLTVLHGTSNNNAIGSTVINATLAVSVASVALITVLPVALLLLVPCRTVRPAAAATLSLVMLKVAFSATEIHWPPTPVLFIPSLRTVTDASCGNSEVSTVAVSAAAPTSWPLRISRFWMLA